MTDKLYDAEGQLLDGQDAWGALFGDKRYRALAATEIEAAPELPRGAVVTTAYWGRDYGLDIPCLYRSEVSYDRVNVNYERYWATRAEALAGHDHIVAAIRDPVAVNPVHDPPVYE